MVEAALTLLVLVLGPAAGGALIHHLWTTRPRRPTHTDPVAGRIPMTLRRRRQAMPRCEGSDAP